MDCNVIWQISVKLVVCSENCNPSDFWQKETSNGNPSIYTSQLDVKDRASIGNMEEGKGLHSCLLTIE